MADGRGELGLIFAFLVGGIIGAGLGLLFAPQTGAKTRKQVKKIIDNLLEEAGDKFEDVKEKVEEKFGIEHSEKKVSSRHV